MDAADRVLAALLPRGRRRRRGARRRALAAADRARVGGPRGGAEDREDVAGRAFRRPVETARSSGICRCSTAPAAAATRSRRRCGSRSRAS
jgi:hypothetical protein